MSASDARSLVEIQGLTKTYGTFEAVKDLNLSVSSAQIFALLGPNGAGKTTHRRMLMGILAPKARGLVSIVSCALPMYAPAVDCFRDRVEVKRRVGYLPDEPVFYDYRRGSEIVRYSTARCTD